MALRTISNTRGRIQCYTAIKMMAILQRGVMVGLCRRPGSKSGLESNVWRLLEGLEGVSEEEVWVDSRKYKFVLRHRMASFLSFSPPSLSPPPLFALSLLCLFPTPPVHRKGQQLNNAWRRFAGPQISSSARSPRDAPLSPWLPRHSTNPSFLHLYTIPATPVVENPWLN